MVSRRNPYVDKSYRKRHLPLLILTGQRNLRDFNRPRISEVNAFSNISHTRPLNPYRVSASDMHNKINNFILYRNHLYSFLCLFRNQCVLYGAYFSFVHGIINQGCHSREANRQRCENRRSLLLMPRREGGRPQVKNLVGDNVRGRYVLSSPTRCFTASNMTVCPVILRSD